MEIEFFLPGEEFRPFVTTFYHVRVTGPEDTAVEDWLHPEWANLRFHCGPPAAGAVGGGPLRQVPRAVVTGPTSMATRFRSWPGRSWGIGLLPLGWAKFTGASAANHADRFGDAEREEAFAGLAAVGAGLCGAEGDPAAEKGVIEARLRPLLARPVARAADIVAVQQALLDPDIASVAQLSARAGMSARTLERFTPRIFGFPPQILLRRQRFLRSLARFMLDPSLSWIDTLDPGYHDQAHFVRDFKRFMTMGPREYSRLSHPVLRAAAKARAALVGEAVQGLHPPSAPAAARPAIATHGSGH